MMIISADNYNFYLVLYCTFHRDSDVNMLLIRRPFQLRFRKFYPMAAAPYTKNSSFVDQMLGLGLLKAVSKTHRNKQIKLFCIQ